MANPVIHFEILGKDGKQTQAFYAALFGWNVDASNPMEYGMVSPQEGVGIGGGVAASMDGKPLVTVYIDVADLGTTLAEAERLGGTIVMPPMDVPGGPKIAQFSDPDGNIIGLTQAGSMEMPS